MVRTRKASLFAAFEEKAWYAEREDSLVELFYNVSTKRGINLADGKSLVAQCIRAVKGLESMFCYRTTLGKVYWKLCKIKDRFLKFEDFIKTIGVSFDESNNLVSIDRSVYPYTWVSEPPLWKYFAQTGFRTYAKVKHLVYVVDMPLKPLSDIGSASNPITLPDSDDEDVVLDDLPAELAQHVDHSIHDVEQQVKSTILRPGEIHPLDEIVEDMRIVEAPITDRRKLPKLSYEVRLERYLAKYDNPGTYASPSKDKNAGKNKVVKKKRTGAEVEHANVAKAAGDDTFQVHETELRANSIAPQPENNPVHGNDPIMEALSPSHESSAESVGSTTTP